MARPRLLAGPPSGDPARQVVRAREGVGQRRASRDRRVPIGLHDLEGVEAPRDRRPAVEGAERGRDAFELCGLAEALGRRDRAVDEPGDEPALRLDEADDVGADARRLCRARRRELDRAVDAEEVGVLSCDPQHEHAVGPRHLHVVVGDAPAQDLPLAGAVGPDALDRRPEPGFVRVAHDRAPQTLTRGSSRRPGRTAARPQRRHRPIRRRSRRPPPSRGRTSRAGTRRRSTTRRCSRSRRS